MVSAEDLVKIVGSDWVVTGKEQTESYKVDATPPAMMPKAAENIIVVKPTTAEEISSIMKLANREKTPVYVRGGGTGMAGAAIPTLDGVVLSMERFDKIEEIDTNSLMAVAEAGVTLGQLLEAADAQNMSFPPHPGDEGAQLGGLVVCNAGGARAGKLEAALHDPPVRRAPRRAR